MHEIPVRRQEISIQKATPKIDPFPCTISKDRIFHMLYSRVGYPEKNGFDSYGSSLIVDDPENDNT